MTHTPLTSNPSFIQTFHALGNTRIYQDGNNISLCGEHVYLLERGYVKVIHPDRNGSYSFKYLIKPGDVFGSLGFLLYGNDCYREHALTVGLVQLASLPQTEAHRLCESNPEFKRYFLQTIGKRIIRLEKRTDILLHGNAEERVTYFILDYLDANGTLQDGKLVAPNLLTHQEISTLAVTSRQTVTKVLNQLRQQGTIDYDTKQMVRNLNAPETVAI